MTAIMLTHIDNHRNMARFYKLDVQPALFGRSLVKEWGAARSCRYGSCRAARDTRKCRYRADFEVDGKAEERLSIMRWKPRSCRLHP